MRAVGISLALLLSAWFALGARQASETQRASTILSAASHTTPASARHAAALLRSAGFLNPDRQVDVLRAQLERERGRPAAARAILRPIVLSEPENLQAWLELARSSAGDPRDFYTAAYRLEQLVPRVRNR